MSFGHELRLRLDLDFWCCNILYYPQNPAACFRNVGDDVPYKQACFSAAHMLLRRSVVSRGLPVGRGLAPGMMRRHFVGSYIPDGYLNNRQSVGRDDPGAPGLPAQQYGFSVPR